MDTLEALFTRRSIRRYTDEPVSEEMIRTLLKAGMYAPSANNRQPWHFVVIRDPALREQIITIHAHAKMLRQAPLAIAVCADTTRSERYWALDCAAATQNILLAAHALGLGAVWLAVYPNPTRVPALSKLLHLPEHVTPVSMVAVGHPAEQKGPVERFRAEAIHYETW